MGRMPHEETVSTEHKGGNAMNRLLSDKKAVFIFMLPALLFVVCMMYIPIGWTIGYSFFDGFPGFGSSFVGFQNYIDIWKDRVFTQSFSTTLLYTVIQVVGQVGLGLLLAFLLKLGVKKHKDIMKTIIFFPSVIPAIAVAQLFIKIYEVRPQLGLLNSLLSAVGRADLVKGWLGETSSALLCLSIADIWRFMGFYAVLFYAAIIEIPEEIAEAARVDGVNTWQMIRYILLPLIVPVIITATSYCFIGTIKVFEMPYVMTNGGPGYATTLMSLYIYSTAFTYSRYGLGCSMAVILLLETLLVTVIIRSAPRLFSKNEHLH